MASPLPTGLLPSEIRALRTAAGISVEDFAQAFGVSANVVEQWESLGVPRGPTALAIRLVAQSMEFDFPEPIATAGDCTICGAPACERYFGLPVCATCQRDPVRSMEAVGFELARSHNALSNQTTYEVRLPANRTMRFSGRFLSEGLGTLLTKIFKDEPQIGRKDWDDAVYVQWVEPGLEALPEDAARSLIRSLVSYGLLDVDTSAIALQNAPSWGAYEETLVLQVGLLASIKS